MKKILFLITIIFSTVFVSAQRYETVKNLFAINQFEKAKTEFDKAITNAKYASKPEAYLLKTGIYAGLLAADTSLANSPAGENLLKEAEEAFKKYKEMDATLSLLNDDLIYKNAPYYLYVSSYNYAYKQYIKMDWKEAFNRFVPIIELSDYLIKTKTVNFALDTNGLALAGFTAEKNDKKDEAAKYYLRLIDAKVTGEGYDNIYQYIVRYYISNKNIELFEKYKKIGAEAYPDIEFFTYDKVDFAFGLAEGFANKSKALQEVLAEDPTNFKANQLLGEIIYDTLNSDKKGHVMPANVDELEKIMVTAFNKAAAAKSGFENPYLYLGDHFYTKAVKTNEARIAHAADMKNHTKPGTMASKEDIAKRDMLDKTYGNQLESAREPYEKAVVILEARAKEKNGLDIRDKEQYKKAANFLSEIAQYNRIRAKGNATDVAKYTAQEKKWNDLYDSIKTLPTIKN